VADKIWFFLRKNAFILLMSAWLLLCLSPWAIWLESAPWVRMGISILLFVTPGVTISLLLAGRKLSLFSHFTSGLALSMLLVSVLGLFGRALQLPFSFIKPVFILIGLIGFATIIKQSRPEQQWFKPKRVSVITIFLFLGIAALGILVSFGNRFGGDDLSYLSYLTNWQHAQPLNFQEVIFGSGGHDKIRFWLAMLPMNLAFLAEISNLHGLLLLGFYLEPCCVVIALLALYNLYEDLLQSELRAITALLLQFTFLFLLQGARQPGSTFFLRLSEDKAFAAFILTPIFFLAARYFLESFTLRSGIFTLLIGFSLALTHPVILAYGIFIAGIYISIVTLIHRDYKKFGVIAAVLVFTILPSASLRFVPSTNQAAFDMKTLLEKTSVAVNEPLVSPIKGTPFYGFNLERIKITINGAKPGNPIQIFLSWSYLWLLGLGFLWAVFNLKKNTTAPFVAATSLLVLVCAIPYTGWLVGYAVSPRMLWRSPWLLPTGLIGTVLSTELYKFISKKASTNTQPKIFTEQIISGVVLTISILLIGYFSTHLYAQKWQSATQLDEYRNKLESLSALGNYLENNIELPSIFVAPPKLRDYLPGLSSKSKVVFFRSHLQTISFSHNNIDIKKINLILSQDSSISIKKRMSLLEKNRVQYILVEDQSLKDYYAGYPQFFAVQKIDNFWIVEFSR
jgi:hypothetical protein